MAKYKAIVFDFDLTLADSLLGFVESHATASRAIGLTPPSLEAIGPTLGTPLPEVFLRLHGAANADRTDEYLRVYHQRADEVMTGLTSWLDGAPETLRSLHARAMKLGIVSQKLRYRVEDVLHRDGMAGLFGAVIGGDDVEALKPDPAGLLLATERLGVAPGASLYIGDTTIDAETARRAGVGFVAVLSGFTDAEAFTEYAPLTVLNSVTELPDFLGLRAA
jgi:phosphoglycolate phosphatase